ARGRAQPPASLHQAPAAGCLPLRLPLPPERAGQVPGAGALPGAAGGDGAQGRRGEGRHPPDLGQRERRARGLHGAALPDRRPPALRRPLQWLLEEESALHRDIVQQDFLDTYNNLTLKTLMGLEWVSRHCPNASYVMKADSDIFLNVGFLVRQLLQPQLPPKKNFMMGHVYRNTGPLRSKAYKWYVPREVYPNDTYPPYCCGAGYVLSGDLAKKVYGVAQTLRVINMEDAFVGICLYELGVSVTSSPGGLFHVFQLEYETCRFSKLVLVHRYGPADLLRVWPDFQGGNKTCPS
ncbi:beta-1,3-galactosyltransferase 2-like, partial [Chelydra serpentina]